MAAPNNNRTIKSYPRETTGDFIPFLDLTVNGEVPDPADVEYAVVPEWVRPTSWASAAVDELNTPGFVLNGPVLGRGVFTVYARVEGVVIDLGSFRLT